MGPLKRAVFEYRNLFSVLSAPMSAVLLAKTVVKFPSIAGSGKLTALDRAMSKDVVIKFHGKRVDIPLHRIDRALAPLNDNPTFGNIREMFANDVYLKRFKSLAGIDVVFDFGSNRGLFLLIAHLVFGAKTLVRVEPQKAYEEIFDLLCDRNGLNKEEVLRVNKFVSSFDDAENISVSSLMKSRNATSIDFLKCDIEGAEYRLFGEGDGWIGSVKNLAMELHPHLNLGKNQTVTAQLEKFGFHWVATDQFGREVPVERADFLYASSVGNLIG